MDNHILFQDKNSANKLLAGLNAIGLNYIIGEESDLLSASELHYPPADLIAGLALHKDARLRSALIALFLYKPDFSQNVLEAMGKLQVEYQLMLKVYYTAAVFLQKIYRQHLLEYISDRSPLPDLYSVELGIAKELKPEEALKSLAHFHRETSGLDINWLGTYRYAAERLISRLQKETLWTT